MKRSQRIEGSALLMLARVHSLTDRIEIITPKGLASSSVPSSGCQSPNILCPNPGTQLIMHRFRQGQECGSPGPFCFNLTMSVGIMLFLMRPWSHLTPGTVWPCVGAFYLDVACLDDNDICPH